MTTAPTTTSETSAGFEALLRKIQTGRATAAVIGLGYVGLPLAHALHEGGLKVVGLDVDPAKIDALERGESYLKHLDSRVTSDLTESERFHPSTDFDLLEDADVVIVAVPTPLGPHHEPDLSYVIGTARQIGARLRPGTLVLLESTTYPGTTRDEFLPAILEAARAAGRDEGSRVGETLFAAFSPEREDPGREGHTTRTIPKLVGGIDERSTALAVALYEKAVDKVVPVRTAEVAEAAKLLENIFRAVNIALVNEMKVVLTELGVDVWEVVDAAATKPFGFMPFYPGPGLGGHCIPIDPFYLTWKAKEVGRPTRFIELAGEVNTQMPEYVVNRLMHALNEHGKAVKGARVLVLGLAYKPNVDDTRESPSFELIERLRALGAEVDYSDPHIPVAPRVRKHDLRLESVETTPENLAGYDAVLVSTAHKAFDWEAVARHSKLVVDTRNALKPWENELGSRLVRA